MTKPDSLMLVTGGSRGIGAATAVLAAQRGFDVCINYAHDASAAETVAAAVRAAGRRAQIVQGNVSEEADVKGIFAACDAMGRLTCLVNNAGVVDVRARLDEMDLARWKRMFDINVIGTFLCAREAIKRMSTRHGGVGGSIVNLSSAAARLGSPAQYVDYAASKGAIDTFTVGLARELAGEGIRVNAVRPGIIDTDIHASGGEPDRVQQSQAMIPMRRAGTAQEMAEAILWLASAQSSYSTGAIIDATGGR
jgi:NAD(P)-dependent dehydrogenase (short-subunit alcohol dehydrogenase family)